jgi:metallophosphoesterase (TIGR03767 family)
LMPATRRVLAAVAVAAAVVAVAFPVTPVQAPKRCATTTLKGTIVYEDGALKCGPGLGLTTRDELTKAKSASRTPESLLSFVALTDFQLPDEESPLRGDFTDKCSSHPAQSAFRWNDTMLPHLINSMVRAANDISYGPKTGRPFDFAVQLGDAAENQQFNEVRWFIDLLDGGHVVDPSSGGPSFEGVQGSDPYASPVSGTSLRELANRPFWAEGLRRPDGSPLPWYSVMGNHDMKVRGTVTNDKLPNGQPGAWMTVARQWVTGRLLLNDLPPDAQQRVCKDPTVLIDPAFWTQIALQQQAGPRLITADEDRRLLDRSQWRQEHFNTVAGQLKGHGYANHCKDASGAALERSCFAITLPSTSAGEPGFHLIGLDTGADEGLEGGNIDAPQWDWLNRELDKYSSCSYESDTATTCTAIAGGKRHFVIVFSHHTAATSTNNAPRLDGVTTYYGADLEKLFIRYPNVILHATGHTHENKIYAHPGLPGRTPGYWEVNTSAVADFPHQARTIEIADNHDGTLSIFAVNFDAAAPVDPSVMQWTADDTPETHAPHGGLERNTNEEMLASIGRWVGANDPQSGAAATNLAPLGQAVDRNVELLLTHPAGVIKRPIRPPVVPPGFNFPRPPIRFPFPFPFKPTLPPGFQFPPPGSKFPPVTEGPRCFARGGQTQCAVPQRGIGAPAKTASHDRTVRASVMMVFGMGGLMWLIRARVRRNMIGL